MIRTRIEILALIIGLVVLGGVFELVRRRRLREEYSILWLAASLTIVGLALHRGGLDTLSQLMGIYYPPMVLVVLAGFFGLLLAIHFSLVISRLSSENRTLAQEFALLRREVEQQRSVNRVGDANGGRAVGAQPASDPVLPHQGDHS